MLNCRQIANYLTRYKNPFKALFFRFGFFEKGKQVNIKTRDGKSFIVARRGDYWLLDSVAQKKGVDFRNGYFVTEEGFMLRQGTSDTYIYKEIFIDGVYNEVLGLIDKNSVVIDAGCHIGLFSLFVGPYCSKVIAVEAEKNNYTNAVKNIENSGFSNKMEVLYKALWSNTDDILYIDEQPGGLNTSENKVNFALKNSGDLGVKTLSLVDLINLYDLDKCDLLKMDIEGAEYEVLLKDLTVFERIKSICMEYHKDITEQYSHEYLIDAIKQRYNNVRIHRINETTGYLIACNDIA